jgi:ACS family D-galactonate transporter-like MFS transporter
MTTHARFGVVCLLFVNVVVNYMDRANLSVAAPALARDLHLTSSELGWVFSAFGWTYAALQIPGGWLVDVISPRLLYTVTLLSWSVTTMLQSLAGGFIAMFGLRAATGACEAPAFPINNRVVTGWFPEGERASAIAFYTSGQYVGLAFLYPVMTFIQQGHGWRALFFLTGLVGLVWGVVWYVLYRDPRGPIGRDGAPEAESLRVSPRWRDLSVVCRHRKLWGLYVGQFAVASTLWFFLTWFPTYLETYRGFRVTATGGLRSIPFLAALAGILTSGLLSDFLARRGVSVGTARKMPVLVGLVLTTTIVGANYVSSQFSVIVFLSIAFFGNGMASITWVFVSLLAPSRLLGLTGGVFNFFGNLSSIVVPVVIGYLVDGGDFAPALLFIAALALGGACAFVFLVGPIPCGGLEEDSAAST